MGPTWCSRLHPEVPRPGAAGGIPGAKGITAGSSQRRVQRSVVRAPAAHCARCEWGARTNQRLVLPPGPRPSCPLPGDPDVTGTFPPPPPQAPLAEPRGCRRARAASCPAQSGGRVRAPKPVPDAPPAPERALPRASPALGPPLASPPTQLHLRTPPPRRRTTPFAPVTVRQAAGPESSQPPHCTTRLPNCLHSPACECVCIQRESPGGGGGGGKGEGGVRWPGSVRRTHSLTLSHSLRARLVRAHTRREPRSAQDPKRRGKVALAFAPGLVLGSAFAPRLLRACGILPWRLGTSRPPAAAASASGTAGSLDNNSGGAPSKAPRAGARRGPANRTGLRPRDQRGPRVHRERSGEAPALPAVGAEPSSVCKLHPAGWNKSRLQRRARSAFPRGSPDVQTRGPPRPGTGCGSVPCALP